MRLAGSDAIEGSVRQAASWNARQARVRTSAFIHIPLGNAEEAISCLERACAERNAFTWWIRDSPVFDPLRTHPRFPKLLEKIVPA